MSDTIGVIGQKYEDRKSKKSGVLLNRDTENKKLSFLDENAEPFTVSFAAFKSNWRKVIPAEPVNEVEEPEVESSFESAIETEPAETETTETEPVEEPEVKLVGVTEDEKIKDFVKTLTEARVASVDIIADEVTIMIDNITVCSMNKVAEGYSMTMLPDIFIFSDWHSSFKAGDIHFNVKKGAHTFVSIDCVRATLGDILQFIKTAAVEINLYGYID